jgi:hypothetical protein
MSVVLSTDQELDAMDRQLNIAMAVCYIRMHKITKAMPYINEVLAGKKDEEWRRHTINRFREELIASALNDDSSKPVQKKNYYGSIKKVIHDSLCNPEKDLYKIWNNNLVKLLLSKKVIGSILFSAYVFKLDTRLLAAAVIALIAKIAAEVYCEKCRDQK